MWNTPYRASADKGLQHCTVRITSPSPGMFGIAAGIGLDQSLYQRVPHHIGSGESADGNALDTIENLGGFHQSAELSVR